ncbi:MAG: hypothetical protein CME06_00650 [Gemmatimonadetes bacterium]|nr:hypothetical protein [Gemmatimonadota bacterium]
MAMSVRSVLVIAATPSELRELGSGPWSVLTLGVGLVEAALALADAADSLPTQAWLIGTAGAYPGSGLEIGQVVMADSYRFASAAAVQGRAHLPDAQPTVASPPAPAHTAPPDYPRVATLTTPSLTLAPRNAAFLGRLAQVEHLELFAAARWAERAGIEFGALLGISNEVGPSGHEQWLRFHHQAEAAAARALRALLLDSGSSGA